MRTAVTDPAQTAGSLLGDCPHTCWGEASAHIPMSKITPNHATEHTNLAVLTSRLQSCASGRKSMIYTLGNLNFLRVEHVISNEQFPYKNICFLSDTIFPHLFTLLVLILSLFYVYTYDPYTPIHIYKQNSRSKEKEKIDQVPDIRACLMAQIIPEEKEVF